MRKQAFDFVFLEVMELDPDDPLLKGLNKASVPPSIPAVITLTDTQIASIQVPQDDGSTTRLPIYSILLIRVLQAWNFYLLVEHNIRRIDRLDTTMINSEYFDEYCVSTYDPNAPIKSSSGLTGASNPTTSSASPSTSSKYARTPADDCRRVFKRDKGHYNKIKDEKQWDEWKRATISTINAHGIKNFISPAYIPITPDDVALFNKQNKFMYDGFNTVLKTSMGKHFVRNHENARDAQAVWKDYLHYMRTSTKADMQIEDLMTVLTSFRLTSTYRGTSQKFIADWLDKIRQYEDLTPKSAHFPDVMRKAMLQNALNDVKAFVDVKVSEQMDIAKGRSPIPYDQYVFQKVAGTYDKANSANAANRQRTANQHDFYEDEADIIPYNDDDFVFGSTYYDVNQHNQGSRSGGHRPMWSPSLKRATWQALSREDQVCWDKMSNAAKQSIIFNHSNPPTATQTRTPQVCFQPPH
jgi:hypothetical protein